jgi:hypothetical protein
VDKSDDRPPHVFIGAEEAVVDPELATAIADDDRAVGREPDTVLSSETDPLQPYPQLLSVPRRTFPKLQRELIAITP